MGQTRLRASQKVSVPVFLWLLAVLVPISSSRLDAGSFPPWGPYLVQTAPAEPIRTTLGSGLRVVCVGNPATQTVALSAFITTSACAETFLQAGIRHFVARALVDCSALDDPALAGGLEALGAETYVGAGVDFTEVTLLAMAEDVGPAAHLLRDILFRPRFEPASLDRLRRELATRLSRADELPESAAEKAAAARLFPGHPYGWPVEGLVASVAGFTPADVRRVYAGSYVANNLVIVAAGGLNPEASEAAIREAFGTALPGARLPETTDQPPPLRSSRETLQRPGAAAVVYVGARAPGVSDPHYSAATVALAALGSGLGSRLYQALRREDSLAYTVTAGAVTARSGARADLLVSCPPERVGEVETSITKEVDRLAREAPTTEEIQRAREYICTSYALAHQRNADLAHTLGAFEVAAQEGFELDRDLPALIRKVTPEEVSAATRAMFLTTAVVRVMPS